MDADTITVLDNDSTFRSTAVRKVQWTRNSANGFSFGWPEDSSASEEMCADPCVKGSRMWLHGERVKERGGWVDERVRRWQTRKGGGGRGMMVVKWAGTRSPIAAGKVDPVKFALREGWSVRNGCMRRLYDVFWCDSTAGALREEMKRKWTRECNSRIPIPHFIPRLWNGRRSASRARVLLYSDPGGTHNIFVENVAALWIGRVHLVPLIAVGSRAYLLPLYKQIKQNNVVARESFNNLEYITLHYHLIITSVAFL